MAGLSRIVTVDPAGVVSQMVRASASLLDTPIIQIEAPAAEAIEEVKSGNCNVVISSWFPDEGMQGWELAARIRQISEEIPVIILAHEEDLDMDEETRENSPFYFLQRPIDSSKFLRVMRAALNGGNIQEAMEASEARAITSLDMGPVPSLDVKTAQSMMDPLLADLGAMAILLATREGEILVQSGAAGFLDPDQLTQSLIPVVSANLAVKEIVGGQAANLQFYDGDNFDVFVLTIGLHHFMMIIFEGAVGNRKLGVVNTWGWRTVNDLLAMLGGAAWQIEQPRLKKKSKVATQEAEVIDEPVHLDRGFFGDGTEETEAVEIPEPESVIPQLDAIPEDEFDLDDLFGSEEDLGDIDDLFDPEKLEEMAKETGQGNQITMEEAQRLGLIDTN